MPKYAEFQRIIWIIANTKMERLAPLWVFSQVAVKKKKVLKQLILKDIYNNCTVLINCQSSKGREKAERDAPLLEWHF